MKKLYLFSFIVLNYSFLFSGFSNIYPPELIDFINDPAEFPNKPTIERPLPKEAYEYMYEQHKKNLINSKNFITFLKNRSHFDENEINKQWKLIETLSLNNKNKDLTDLTKPMVVFARTTIDLYYHQLTSEFQLHSAQIQLKKFEQKYPFKLEQIDILEYLYVTENIPVTNRNHYRSVTLKKWARFLIKKLVKK